MNALFLQLYYLLPFMNHPIQIPAGSEVALDKFQNHIRDCMDYKLPFREWAYCRWYSLQNPSPFHEPHVTQPYGFFSAVLFRAIFFRSQYLYDHHPVLFYDLRDWQRCYETLRAQRDISDGYFFKCTAYGAWTRRSLETIPTYFKACQDAALIAWLSSPVPARFLDVYHTLRKTELLPFVGELQTYLIVADYASVGRVAMPTQDEMGEIIFTMKRGSLKGLKLLGFPALTLGQTQFAFKLVYQHLASRFPADIQQRMPLNPISVEHILCKFDRINVRIYRDFLRGTGAFPQELLFLEHCKEGRFSED
jgi:hypothetical protein